jgi:hypothetical protein
VVGGSLSFVVWGRSEGIGGAGDDRNKNGDGREASVEETKMAGVKHRREGDAAAWQARAWTRRSCQRRGERETGREDSGGVRFFLLFFSYALMFSFVYWYFLSYFLIFSYAGMNCGGNKGGKKN